MKTIIMALAILLAGTTSFARVKKSMARHKHHNTATKRYFCSMHPEIVRKHPGKCSKCGMKLVEGKNFRKDAIREDKPRENAKM